MNRKEYRRALRNATGELSSEEKQEFSRELEADRVMARDYEHVERMGAALSGSAHTAFGPGFSHRVMARLDGKPEEGGAFLIDLLAPLFVRFAPIALVVVLLLGVYNITRAEGTESIINAAFGLETVSADAVLDSLDALAVFEE